MRRLGFIAIACLGMFALAACGDDDNNDVKKDKGGNVQFDGGADQGNTQKDVGTKTEGSVTLPEGGTTEGGTTPKCSKAIVGKVCTKEGGECGSSATCLLLSDTKGICTCQCTPDNSSTSLINEDTCPEASTTKYSQCGSVTLSDGSSKNFCFKMCQPKIGSSDCATGIACHPRSGGAVGIFPDAVCLYTGCTKNTDCPVTTGTTCSVSKKDCPSGQECLKTGSVATPDEGICTKPGKCDTKSGLCAPHTLGKSTAKVGDPCKSDLDCGNAMQCQIEIDQSKYSVKNGGTCTTNSDCCTGGTCTNGKCSGGDCTLTLYRNGYCFMKGGCFFSSLKEFACDSGSGCNGLYYGGLCFKTCDMTKANTCRGNANDKWGDYECRGWNNIFNSTYAPPKPLCESGTNFPCDTFSNFNPPIKCAALGGTGNTTNFSCRDMKNNKLSNAMDPKGYCFDDTGSGTAPTTADAGTTTPDAGVSPDM